MSDANQTVDANREAARLRDAYNRRVKEGQDYQAGKKPDDGRTLAAPLPSQALVAPTSAADR